MEISHDGMPRPTKAALTISAMFVVFLELELAIGQNGRKSDYVVRKWMKPQLWNITMSPADGVGKTRSDRVAKVRQPAFSAAW